MPEKIIKRDGRVVSFDQERIINAIFKAAKAVGGADRRTAGMLSQEVVAVLNEKYHDTLPSVEDVKELVEKILIVSSTRNLETSSICFSIRRRCFRNI